MAITLPFVFVFLRARFFSSSSIRNSLSVSSVHNCLIVFGSFFFFFIISILFALRTNGWPWRRQVATSLCHHYYCIDCFMCIVILLFTRIRWLRERSVICFAAICHPLRAIHTRAITLACGLSYAHKSTWRFCCVLFFSLSFYFFLFFRSYWFRSKINVYDNVELEFFPQKI